MFFPGLVDLSSMFHLVYTSDRHIVSSSFGCMRAELLYLLKPVVTQRDL